MDEKPKPVAGSNPADLQSNRALPEGNRSVVYGRILESIFAHPAFKEILYEVVTKEADTNSSTTAATN